MQQICKQCAISFEITATDLAFYDKVSPVFGAQKCQIPPPTFCPECRQQRRLLWRNERHLYHRDCGLCKKSIVTMYSPDTPYTVYCRDCWWGDGWDRLAYGRDFDFTRPFSVQFDALMKAVPKAALLCINIENCDYTNFQNDARNCYLCFASGFEEDCQYTDWVYYAKNTFDSSFCAHAELDYMNVDCSQTYHSKFCQDSHAMTDCWYCFDCRNCRNCFGCVGLRNKEYYLFNQQLSKEEYEIQVTQLCNPAKASFIQEKMRALKLAHPHRAARILNSENCTGDDIEDCKNCFDSFDIKNNQDCRFNYDSFQMKDSYDANRNGVCEIGYETVGGGYCNYFLFTALSAYANFVHYCFECMNTKYAFGCVGLHHQDYMILNKSYSKEEYEKMVPRIIAHMIETREWGEFLHPSASPFGYNETLAQEFSPLNEREGLKRGYKWHPKDAQHYIPQKIVLPSDIQKVPDTFTQEILACSVTGKNYKITPQELQFYRQENLQLPTKHPNQRSLERLAQKLPRRLYDRACAQCTQPLKTPYAPERPEKVCCEQCYLEAVY